MGLMKMDQDRHHFTQAQAGFRPSFASTQLRPLGLLAKYLTKIIDITEQFKYTHFGHRSLIVFWFRNLILHQSQGASYFP